MAIDLWNRTNSVIGFLSDERTAGNDPSELDPGRDYGYTRPEQRLADISNHLMQRIW